MANYQDHVAMITVVAKAMGSELCKEVVFVGGCTTGLLITDQYSLEQVRHTDDVDLIVHVLGQAGWHSLMEKLREKGFKESMESDAPICAMYLNQLRVDFMPDDESVLSFSNIWYKGALATATDLHLPDGVKIRLVRPDYFVATKLAAYQDRGLGDPLCSRDIEDILNLIDGRAELTSEILNAPIEMRNYIAEQLRLLLRVNSFEHAVEATAGGDDDRAGFIYEKINVLISYANLG